MIDRRERGAVSVMWVIFLIVLLLGAGVYIYSVQSDMANLRRRVDNAEREAQRAHEGVVQEGERHLALSQAVGFRDEGATNVFSSLPAIQEWTDQVRGRFPEEIAATDRTMQEVAARLVAIAEKYQAQAQQAEQSAKTELEQRRQLAQTLNEIQTSTQQRIEELTAQLNDERERGQSQISQLESRVAEVQAQMDGLTARSRETEALAAQQAEELRREVDRGKGRIEQLAEKVKLTGVDSDPWAEDGTVISAGSTGTVAIDIGSRDLLRHGVTFQVFRYGKGGERIEKGTIEVREVEPTMALGVVVDEVDPRDPIAPGDLVASPTFSKERSKVFALVGEFPMFGGRANLERRLEDIGAEVSDRVDSRVDFVVLGSKAPEPDAPELTDTPEYKTAQEMGIQILRAQDLAAIVRS